MGRTISAWSSIVARHGQWPESPWQPPLMKGKKSPGPLIKVFHKTAATHKHFFRPIDPRCVFSLSTHEQWNRAYSWRTFIAHSWRLGECNVDLISCSPNTFLERVLLEQVTWTYSHSLNKLPENYSSSIHCPLMNQLWATHEPLMSFWFLSQPSRKIQKQLIKLDFLIYWFWGQRKTLRTPTHDLLMSCSWTTHETPMDIDHVVRICQTNKGISFRNCLDSRQHKIENDWLIKGCRQHSS